MTERSQWLFRVLAEGEAPEQNLDRTVRQSVPASTYRMYIDEDLGDEIWLWGTTEGNRQYWEKLGKGDVLLFYTAAEQFTIATQVQARVKDAAFAADAWTPPLGGTTAMQAEATDWAYLIILDEPVKIELPPEELADYLGYKSAVPRGFQRVKPDRLDQIRAEYSSVWEYALQYRTSEVSPTTDGRDGPSLEGVVARQFNRDQRVVLRGPQNAGQLARARAIAKQVLSSETQSTAAIDDRISVVSLDASDSYESLIERPADQTENGIRAGRFKRVCEQVRQADGAHDRGHVVILPDIGGIALRSLFGEVTTLFADTDSTDQQSVTLRYSREEFTLPENLYIIATADERTHETDDQLNEYFRIIELSPAYSELCRELPLGEDALSVDSWPPAFDVEQRIQELADPVATALASIQLLWQLNRQVETADTEAPRLGHKYLAGQLGSRTELRDAWVVDLLPIIRRHAVLQRVLRSDLPVVRPDGSINATASFEDVHTTVSELLEQLTEQEAT